MMEKLEPEHPDEPYPDRWYRKYIISMFQQAATITKAYLELRLKDIKNKKGS